MDRVEIADLIVARLEWGLSDIKDDFRTGPGIPTCQIMDLLPVEIATRIYAAFPDSGQLMLKRSIKENKLVGAQMDQFDPLLEEAVFAFQDARVVRLVGEITGLELLEPDSDLYAGGISEMKRGSYLRPHLDNSHDKDRQRYRALNLLYYVTPDWRESYGGSLQLWDDGPDGEPRTIPSLFNSLVIMITNKSSWHSVNEVQHEGSRRCVSNYFFSRVCPDETEYFHATSFRAERARGLSDLVMRADNSLRTKVLETLGGRIWKNPHVYQKDRE